MEGGLNSRAKGAGLSVLRSSDSVLVPSLNDLPVKEGSGDGRESSDSTLNNA